MRIQWQSMRVRDRSKLLQEGGGLMGAVMDSELLRWETVHNGGDRMIEHM